MIRPYELRLILALACVLSSPAVAAELHVPSEFPTIQAAIDASVDGDSVVVAPGIYSGAGNSNINYQGRAITVRSIEPTDPSVVATTIIDCAGEPRGLRFNSGETGTSVVEGFTLKSCSLYAIECVNSSPTIRNCIIEGGGISCTASSPTITDCSIDAAGPTGALRNNAGSMPTVTRCRFRGSSHSNPVTNTDGSHATYRDCEFVDNTARAMSNYRSDPLLINCAFIRNETAANTSFEDGAAIKNRESSPTLIGCTFIGNAVRGAFGFGGAIHGELESHLTLINCVLDANYSLGGGGGIHLSFSSSANLINCTISNNTGDGVRVRKGCSVTIVNSIVWRNFGPEVSGEGLIEISHSCVEGLEILDIAGSGNIAQDPLFESMFGPDGLLGTGDEDLRVHPCSPVVDAGSNAALPADVFDLDEDGDTNEPLPVDVAGMPRIVSNSSDGEPTVDMGAYELSPLSCLGPPPCLPDFTVLAEGVNGPSNSTNVHRIVRFDDGTGSALFVQGLFEVAGDMPARNVAKWDGRAWSPVGDPEPSPVSPAFVGTLTTFDDGTGPALYMMVGALAESSNASSATETRLSRWVPDDGFWQPLGQPVHPNTFNSLTSFDDGSGPALFSIGALADAKDPTARRLAKWDGSEWIFPEGGDLGGPVPTGLTRSVMRIFDDGSGPALFIGHNFQSAGGQDVNYISKWDGASFHPLGAGVQDCPENCDIFSIIRAMEVFDDGSGPALYVGGSFHKIGGIEINGLAKWDGREWSPVGTGLDQLEGDQGVKALTVHDDGSGPALYIGGFFPGIDGVTANNLAKWDGITISPINIGTNGDVLSFVVFDDGSGSDLYVGGNLIHAAGLFTRRIARWTGCQEAVAGDYDSDGDVDLIDFEGYVQCITGPNSTPPAPSCSIFDFDGDADVDMTDLAFFQLIFGTDR